MLIVTYWIPPLIDRASRRDFNGGVVEILVIFRHDGQFLAKQKVKLSSLYDEGRPADVFYHHRRDTLVIALPMVIISLILAFHNIALFRWLLLGGKLEFPMTILIGVYDPRVNCDKSVQCRVKELKLVNSML